MINHIAIISIGDELINGFTTDTNSSWIARKIYQYSSLSVKTKLTLSDNKGEIKASLDYLLDKKYSFIFITGGLGPTHDDITKEALRDYFNCNLVLDDDHLSYLKAKYGNRLKSNFDLIKEQSKILSISTPIPNKCGIALGMVVEYQKTNIFIMPGVPLEMRHMFDEYIVPMYIKNNYKIRIKYITLLTTGIYESSLYEMLKCVIDDNRKKFSVSFLPSYIGVKIRLGLIDESACLSTFKNKIVLEIEDYVYGYDNDKMESIVANILIERKMTLAFAESCTGGYLSKKMTDIPNSSKYFLGSIISYSNEIKKQHLDISDQILQSKGAVSSEVALLMAENIKDKFNADIGISTTGISGPSGGSKDKPVGRIYIAIVFKEHKIVKEFDLVPERSKHREIAVHTALNMLRLLLNASK